MRSFGTTVYENGPVSFISDLLCLGYVDNLGVYSIPPETGLLPQKHLAQAMRGWRVIECPKLSKRFNGFPIQRLLRLCRLR